MESLWHVVYYRSESGDCEIRSFIDSRKSAEQDKIMAWIRLLEEQGPRLPRPYADLLRDGIHELRIKLTGNQFRVLYFFCYQKTIMLTHAFTKTTSRVPEAEIRKAIEIRNSVMKIHKSGEGL